MSAEVENPPADVCYQSPLSTRYADPAVLELFGPRRRILLWRQLWIELARAQRELGLPIDGEALGRLEARAGEIDFEKAAAYEAEFRHDVMAHLHTFGDLVPEAKGFLHLGGTSAFVTDNADLVIVREAMGVVKWKIAAVLAELADFARAHRDLPILGRTHLQPAQPTTLGKRATLWAYDLVLDWRDLDRLATTLPFRGVKGTTGTQDSFLALFDGDASKVEDLDRRIARAFGFERTFPVTGQTYPRKIDATILAALGGVAQSAARFAGDVRVLAMIGELAEGSVPGQVGSSAMPYKRNPIYCERANALARHVMMLATEGAWMAADQRLERTLDDSATRRIILPEAFLATAAILRLVGYVASRLVVRADAIRAHLEEELPLMATERILLAASRKGGDRQELHERIRRHSREVSGPAEILGRLEADPAFAAVRSLVRELANPMALTGLAARQVDRFLAEEIRPVLAAEGDLDREWKLDA